MNIPIPSTVRNLSTPAPGRGAECVLPAVAEFAAFTLAEVLIAMALLSFIILGLVSVFSQTQRAFRSSMNDTDLLEQGRALSDMWARELPEARPSGGYLVTNFFTEFSNPRDAIFTPPLYQALPGTANPPQLRTNYLQSFFFLSRPNQFKPDNSWVATGYYVVPDNAGVGIGTLYRYSFNTAQGANPASPYFLIADFLNALQTARTNPVSLIPATGGQVSVVQVGQGIVHLRVKTFATNGCQIVGDYVRNRGYPHYLTNALNPYLANQLSYRPMLQATNVPDVLSPDRYDCCAFISNGLPASVEIELGILESSTYQRYRAIDAANEAAQLAFLSNHVAQVHLFRQRAPLHNVELSAYQ